MFTGLVEDVGVVERVIPGPMVDLWIKTALPVEALALGESISHSGACLTVVEVDLGGHCFRVQVSPETLRHTAIERWGPGTRVNLERALKVGDRLGGHWVLGHVDGVANLLDAVEDGGSVRIRFSLPESLAPYFIDKGSVAVDGVSLTVNQVGRDDFSVALIPETLKRTTLGFKRPGDAVHLEADVMGKYIARFHRLDGGAQPSAGLTEGALRAAGFSK